MTNRRVSLVREEGVAVVLSVLRLAMGGTVSSSASAWALPIVQAASPDQWRIGLWVYPATV